MSNETIPKYRKVHYQTDEGKQLLPSLPVENGWVSGSSFHLYQGCWLPTFQIQRVLSAQRHFRALDTDIFLATLPKSGTTWLKAIIFALLNRTRYGYGGEPTSKILDHPLLLKNPHDLVPFLELDTYMEEPEPDLSSFTSPRLFATHLPSWSLPETVKETNCKIVYMCRNPKDTFVSYWNFLQKLWCKGTDRATLIPIDEALNKFCKGVSLAGPYWDHVIGYYKASLEMPHKFLFMKYEDMKENPVENLKRLADFISCPFSKEEEADGAVEEILKLCSFGNLSELKVNQTGNLSSGGETNVFFRKGEVGDWVNYLTPEMAEKIDRVTEEKFSSMALKL